MATYTYKCKDCKNIFSVEATIKEKEESGDDKFFCPKCKSKNTEQKFSPAGFIKNVFQGDKKAGNGCCGGGVCCKPDKKVGNTNNSGSCCG